jgi:hypothetical protein
MHRSCSSAFQSRRIEVEEVVSKRLRRRRCLNGEHLARVQGVRPGDANCDGVPYADHDLWLNTEPYGSVSE